MKMKRREIEAKYADDLTKIYDDPEFGLEAEKAT
jgi:hypothetical protein